MITAASDDEARKKAKSIEGIPNSAFWLDLRCRHLVDVWRESYIEDLALNMSFDLERKKERNPLQRGQTEGHRFPLEVYSPIKLYEGDNIGGSTPHCFDLLD